MTVGKSRQELPAPHTPTGKMRENKCWGALSLMLTGPLHSIIDQGSDHEVVHFSWVFLNQSIIKALPPDMPRASPIWIIP